MQALLKGIDRFSEHIGRAVSWLALFMVVMQFALVLARYIFGVTLIAANEAVVYAHGLLFLLAAGYTYLHSGHVRVDLLYRQAGRRTRAWVDLLGNLFFLLPVCALIWWAGFPFVDAAWQSMEGSTEASGLPIKYLYKTAILAFVIALAVQAVGETVRAALVLQGVISPDHDEDGMAI